MDEWNADKLRPGLLNWIEGTNRIGREVAYVAFKPVEDDLFQEFNYINDRKGYLGALKGSDISADWNQVWGAQTDNTRAISVVKHNEVGEITQDFTRLDKLRLEAWQASMTDGLTAHVLDESLDGTSPSIEKTPEMVKRVNEGLVEVFGRNGVQAQVQALENGLTHVVTQSGDLGGDLATAIQNVNAKLDHPVFNASAHTEPKLPSEPVSLESPRTIANSLNKAADAFAEVAAKHPKTTGAAMGALAALPVAFETYTVSKGEMEQGNLPVEGANTLAKGVTQVAGGAATAGPVAAAATPLLAGGPLGAAAYGGVVLVSGYVGAEAAGELYDAGRKLMDEGVNYVHAYFQGQKEARQAYEASIVQNAVKNGVHPTTALYQADAMMNGHLAAANSQVESTATQVENTAGAER